MVPERADHEETGDLTAELESLVSPEDGTREESWPVFGERPPDESELFSLDERLHGRGRRGSWLRGRPGLGVVLLLGALAVVTVAGIVVGRALEPSSAKTPATVASRPRPAPPKPRPKKPQWGPLTVSTLGRLPRGTDRAGAALAGAKLVVAGGVGSDLVLAGPPGGRLRKVAALPGKLASPAVFVIGGTVYVLGGEQGATPTDRVARVDLRSGRVEAAPVFEEPLAEAAVAVSGGSAYLAGGWTGEKYATAVLRYSPSGTTALVARLPTGVRSAATAIVGHVLLVAGGRTAQGVAREVYAVDLASGGVKALGKLPRGVERAAMVVSAGKVYVIGGRTPTKAASSAVVRIDPKTGRTTAVGTVAHPFADGAAVSAGKQTLVLDESGGTVYRVG
jgi:Kelch motif